MPRVIVTALVVFTLGTGLKPASAAARVAAVAVFPVQNLSGGGVSADAIRGYLIQRLSAAGVVVLRSDVLEDFVTRHRVRYLGGIDAGTAEALRREAGVEGIVIPSVELSSDAHPPKVALIVRLVSTESVPVVVWADDVGLSGDDRPGFFELGIVTDFQKLLGRGLTRVADSLLRYVATGELRTDVKRGSKFRPKTFYQGGALHAGQKSSVAVVPFLNRSLRRNGGEILSLLFMRHLSAFPHLAVLDAGVVRRQLLDARIIMDAGLSVTGAETLAALVEADFVLGGQVLRYDDPEGEGRPGVEFSAVLIERKSRRVVWSSTSYNEGDDGVRFFERGRSRTAHTMATQMVRLTAEMIATGER